MIISMKAYKGNLKPKKIIDQSALRTSWNPNKSNATLDSSVFIPFFQIKYSEIPIRKYSVVHTGPKIQFGGLKKGFFNAAYHVGIDDIVKMEPIAPASRQIKIENMSLTALFSFIQHLNSCPFINFFNKYT